MIRDTLIKLISIKSITATGGENEVVDFIHSELLKLEYFDRNRQNLWTEWILGDVYKRRNLCALIEGKTKETVILISHHDVVEASEAMFSPLSYPETILKTALTKDEKSDIESGEWLFGRGAADMKGGLAVQMELIKELSKKTPKYSILFMSFADEELNGAGVHQGVRTITRLQNSGYKFILCIDSEPSISDNHTGACLFTGSIGCITIGALCRGVQSHVGEYYKGVSAARIAAKILESVEGKFQDVYKGITYPPACCLQIRSLDKNSGFVTLPEKTILVFNFLYVAKTPKEIMESFIEKALEAGRSIINDLQGKGGSVQDFKAFAFGELLAEREKCLDWQKAADNMLERLDFEGAAVVAGFISPFCQPRINFSEKSSEIRVRKAVNSLIKGSELKVFEVYEGISDMSEMGYQGGISELDYIKSNLISDTIYPFEDMAELDIPVVNLGPIGKNVHGETERVYLPYLENTLPALIKKLIENM